MKRRKPYNREPPGKTKNTILLLVANNGDTSFQAIRDHLKESLNIRNLKVIRTHIAELVNEWLLLKHSQGKGKPDSFYLSGFDNFKKVYEFFQANQQEQEFMKTEYYNSYIASEDFKFKLIINILQVSIQQRHTAILNKLELTIKDEQSREQYNELIKSIANNSIEDLVDQLRNRLDERQTDNELLKSLIHRCSFVISDEEFEGLIDILLLSPSAIKYCLKPNYVGASFISKLMSQLFNKPVFPIDFFQDIMEYDLTSLSKDSIESSMFVILKSFFIADLLTDEIIKREISSRFINKILKTSDINESITNSRLRDKDLGRETKITH